MTIFSNVVQSQISIGGKVNFMKFFGGLGGSSGVGFRGEYGLDEQKVIVVGFDYYFGSVFDNAIIGEPFTGNNTIEIPVEERLKFIHIQTGSKYYLLGDYEDDMNVYATVLAGLMLAPYSTTIGDYDKTKYYTFYEEEKETFVNFTIGAGIGAEKKMGLGYVFADLNLILPANQAGRVSVSITIPASITFDAGARIPF